MKEKKVLINEEVAVTSQEKKFLKDLGNRLQDVLHALKIQQKDMAEASGLAQSYVSELVNGIRANPGIGFIYNISKAFNVSLDYLVNGIGDIFLPATEKEKDIAAGDFPDFNKPEDVIWLFKNSIYFRNLLLGAAFKIYYENEIVIKRELDREREKKRAKREGTEGSKGSPDENK
jgi:transcriptional regulator with XRE-family HTH domain